MEPVDLFAIVAIILIVSLGILIIANVVNQMWDSELIEKDVPCYDVHNNLIVDVVCKEKIRCGHISFLNHRDCPT